MNRILFVCHGNICRSPMAEFVMKDLVKKAGRETDFYMLMDYTRRPGDVADPWYTGDFEATWRDVLEGCQALFF